MKITPESIFGIAIFGLMILMEFRAATQIRASIRYRRSGAVWGLPMGIAMLVFAGCIQIMMAVEVIPATHASSPAWVYYASTASVVIIVASILMGAKRLLH